MQTWTKDIGTTWTQGTGSVSVTGDASQLYAWSHRSGAAWPCSYLDDCDRVTAELDSRGDLVDLIVYAAGFDSVDGPSQPSDEIDIPSDELTAWIDDNLAGTPFAHLARNPSDEAPHVGHYSRIGGTYWCDTCDSPYCELA